MIISSNHTSDYSPIKQKSTNARLIDHFTTLPLMTVSTVSTPTSGVWSKENAFLVHMLRSSMSRQELAFRKSDTQAISWVKITLGLQMKKIFKWFMISLTKIKLWKMLSFVPSIHHSSSTKNAQHALKSLFTHWRKDNALQFPTTWNTIKTFTKWSKNSANTRQMPKSRATLFKT